MKPRGLSWRLVCIVLASYALVLVSAGLSPWLKPVPWLDAICSANGSRITNNAAGSAAEPNSGLTLAHALDCPLCLPGLATGPLWATERAQVMAPESEVAATLPPSTPVWRAAAPLPARGPPAAA